MEYAIESPVIVNDYLELKCRTIINDVLHEIDGIASREDPIPIDFLFEEKFDSLDSVDVTMALEIEFDIEIPEEFITETKTYGDLVNVMRKLVKRDSSYVRTSM